MTDKNGGRRSTPAHGVLLGVTLTLAVLSTLSLFVYFYRDARGGLMLGKRFFLLFAFVALSYTAARLYLYLRRAGSDDPAGGDGTKRVLFPLFALYFALYLYLLLTLTLLDPSLGRDLVYAENSRAYYVEWYVNLRPFRSIWNVYLVGGLGKGLLSHASILFNLVGNLAMLMPLSFFLPLFFSPMRHFYGFCPTVVLTAALIETLQFCFMRGSCDVDDLLLNAGGAILFRLILKIPPVSRAVGFLTAGLLTFHDGKKAVRDGEND